jgi:hypothetical protein
MWESEADVGILKFMAFAALTERGSRMASLPLWGSDEHELHADRPPASSLRHPFPHLVRSSPNRSPCSIIPQPLAKGRGHGTATLCPITVPLWPTSWARQAEGLGHHVSYS